MQLYIDGGSPTCRFDSKKYEKIADKFSIFLPDSYSYIIYKDESTGHSESHLEKYAIPTYLAEITTSISV